MESTAETRNCVIDSSGIERKLKRMALEIAEQNPDAEEIILAGINGNGEVVVKALQQQLQHFTGARIHNLVVRLDKKDPMEVKLDPVVNFDGKIVLIVDDVANSGLTMLYAMKPFLQGRPSKIQTLVLVERSHKKFPVQVDYKGLSLATTLQEHIAVETGEEGIKGAWLY